MPTPHGRPGRLVAFEGIDGAGKSTLIAAVADALAATGVDVRTTREPTEGPWGRKIRQSAQTGRLAVEEELRLFELDRREHVATRLLPWLDEGATILIDRYFFSSAAYQGARGLDAQAILAHHRTFAPEPDLLLVLDLDVDTSLARVGQRGAIDAFESRELLAKSRSLFLAFGGTVLDAKQATATLVPQVIAAITAVGVDDRS
jgi:dTMP kinase